VVPTIRPLAAGASSPRDLLLIGAGGFAREAAEAVHAVNALRPVWRLLGFLDDDPHQLGRSHGHVRVLGPIETVHDHPEAAVVLCTGRPDAYASRRLIAARLGLPEDRYATIVHPTASVGASCRIGAGSVLLAHTVLTADVGVGRHVGLMPQVVLTHDVTVGDFATLASGVRAGGSCRIGEGAYVGSGACLREGVEIGARALVGMAAVVTRDVPDDRLWYGSPARDVSPAPGAVLEAAGRPRG
jgi:sugar O-acyltransferase (sialic acid O-acetyltransferase NeuD family)